MAAVTLDPHSGGVPQAPPARVPTLVQVALFFGITFALTWAAFLPLVLRVLSPQEGWGALLQALGIFAPTGTAFVLTALAAGRHGVRRLWWQGLRWRVGAGWYAFVLLGPGLAVGAALAVTAALGDQAPAVRLSVDAAVAAVVSGLLAGTFEEFGWSGFAFPTLQARSGFVRAGVAMGVAVALWHLPFFFAPGTTQSSSSFVFFLLQLLPARLLFGWIYNGTGGSVLLTILFHGSWNAWGELLGPGPMVADPYGLTQTALLLAAAVAVLLMARWAVPRPRAA